jgi:hypothetical protein
MLREALLRVGDLSDLDEDKLGVLVASAVPGKDVVSDGSPEGLRVLLFAKIEYVGEFVRDSEGRSADGVLEAL